MPGTAATSLVATPTGGDGNGGSKWVPALPEVRDRDTVALSDYGRDGAPIRYKAWVCSNPECGFNIRIDNGEVTLGRTIGQSYK